MYLNFLPQATSLLRARMLYERLVTQFPTSGRYWRLYIEHEVKAMWIIWCSSVIVVYEWCNYQPYTLGVWLHVHCHCMLMFCVCLHVYVSAVACNMKFHLNSMIFNSMHVNA